MSSRSFTPIDNRILQGICATLTHNQARAMLYLLRHTIGYHRDACITSYGEIAGWTGMARRCAISAVRDLAGQGLITITDTEPTLRISINAAELHWIFLERTEAREGGCE